VQTTRRQESFDASNSSLACSSGELSQIELKPVGDSMHFLQFSDFSAKWCFWATTLVPDMLEGQSKALWTRESILFPNKFWAKILVHLTPSQENP